MKTIKTLTILALCLITLNSAIANEADTNEFVKMPVEVQKVLANQMHFPEIAKSQEVEGSISICFYITPKGTIIVNCVDGMPILKEEAKLKMENIIMPSKMACANKNMMVKYKFEIED